MGLGDLLRRKGGGVNLKKEDQFKLTEAEEGYIERYTTEGISFVKVKGILMGENGVPEERIDRVMEALRQARQELQIKRGTERT